MQIPNFHLNFSKASFIEYVIIDMTFYFQKQEVKFTDIVIECGIKCSIYINQLDLILLSTFSKTLTRLKGFFPFKMLCTIFFTTATGCTRQFLSAILPKVRSIQCQYLSLTTHNQFKQSPISSHLCQFKYVFFPINNLQSSILQKK